jgi:hypothetical protein
VNYQIVLYLMSRVAVATGRVLAAKGVAPFNSDRLAFSRSYPYLACLTWAGVMWLYENEPGTLQNSLVKSMDEIYHQVDVDEFVGIRSKPNS